MIIDGQTTLWNAAALTATAVSDFAYDLGAAAVTSGTIADPTSGEPLCVAMAVLVAADSTTGNETYEFDTISATASDLTTGQVIIAKYVILAANLSAGTLVIFPLQPHAVPAQRYLGMKAVLGGTTPTITVTAWITSMKMVQTYKAFSSKIVVL